MARDLGAKRVLAVLAAGGLAATATIAMAQGAAPARTGVLQALMDCRTITDDAARLACFDLAAGAFDQAEAKGEVVVVDREQATAVRRQAFGFTLPSLTLFDRPGNETGELDRISAKVARASQDGAGRWIIELEDGAIWQQTDNEGLARRPRAGSTAEIRTAAMGSFFMNLDGQRAVRARRVK